MFRPNKKSGSPLEKPPYSAYLTMSMLSSGFATLLAHPCRVLLNEASVNTNPLTTIRGASNKMFHDAHINILRGTTSTGLQSIVKYHVHQHYGADTYKGRFLSILGTAIAGLTVTPIETAFMRKNALRSTLTSLDAAKSSSKSSLLKYNLPIFAFFGIRELGFTSSIFGTDNLSLFQRFSIILPSALVTAITHKLVSIEITKDIRQIAHLVPDYKIGFCAVIRNIAYGNVYKHDSFRVPITQPKSMSQLTVNFFSATCGPNMYFWRLTYLTVFASLLSFTSREVNRLFTNEHEHEEKQIESNSPRMK